MKLEQTETLKTALEMALPILKSARKQCWEGAYEAEEAVRKLLEVDKQNAEELVELPEIYEQYLTWPEDIRKKLSIYDLRRMTGWKLHCCSVNNDGVSSTALSLVRVLRQIKECLVDASESGVITDTLWYSGYQTLLDYIDEVVGDAIVLSQMDGKE